MLGWLGQVPRNCVENISTPITAPEFPLNFDARDHNFYLLYLAYMYVGDILLFAKQVLYL